MSIKVMLNRVEEMQFVARSEKGPAIILDSSDGNSGPTPMQLLLMSIAGCTAIDMVLILEKKRIEIERFSIEITGDQEKDYPKRFKQIHVKYFLRGINITPKAVEQAIKLSEEKYCSALASVNAEFSHSYHIENKS